ncbi:MAG: hypothetical protein AB9846_16800 [Tenuifilaceae bacterium]
MVKSIGLHLKLRKSNAEVDQFSIAFIDDLKRCFGRFRVDFSVTEKHEIKPDNYQIIFLSSKDIEDTQFVEEIISFSGSENTLLVNLDPIKTSIYGFPIHKFKTYRFWDEIKETNETRLFRRTASENNAFYWEKITDIAVEIADKIGASSKESKKGKIFIAQTDNSQSSDRDNLKRDLIELGYGVLPERLFSYDFNECTEQIKEALKDCKIIIHPIPLVYTKYFSDKQISLIEHQYSLTKQHVIEKGNVEKRIIWIPSDLEITDEENQIFVEKIQRDQEETQTSIILKVTLEELKKIYRRILSGENIGAPIENDLPDVYIVDDQENVSIAENLSKANGSLKVKSNFKGITYNQHLHYLANSQVVVINYTSDNQQWFTMKVNDISKSSGIKSSKPFKKLILVKEKQDLPTGNSESKFSEVVVGDLKSLKLNLAVNNN